MQPVDMEVEKMLEGVPLFTPKNGRAVDVTWMPDVIAIRPLYLDMYGNSSHIYTTDRELYWGHNVVQTANDINGYWFHSHQALRRLYKQYTKRSQSAPLVNRQTGQPLAAMKMRHPSGRNDGAMGYVHTKYIDSLETLYLPNGEYGTTIRLTTGQSLSVLWTQSRVEQQLEWAEYLAGKLHQQNRLPSNYATQGATDLFNALVRLIQDSSRGRI